MVSPWEYYGLVTDMRDINKQKLASLRRAERE